MYNRDGLQKKLREYDRTPFLDMLQGWMEVCPEPADFAEWVTKHPDRWVASMKTLSQMGGFVDKRETETNINVSVQNMTDADLLRRLEEVSGDLRLENQVVDVEAEEVSEEPDKLTELFGQEEAEAAKLAG